MEYLGAWGTLIHEKNLKSKISCQTLFKYYWRTVSGQHCLLADGTSVIEYMLAHRCTLRQNTLEQLRIPP
jgi:hypothetical protein